MAKEIRETQEKQQPFTFSTCQDANPHTNPTLKPDISGKETTKVLIILYRSAERCAALLYGVCEPNIVSCTRDQAKSRSKVCAQWILKPPSSLLLTALRS